MRSLVLATFLAVACSPGIASALVPDPLHCVVPAYLDLVGSNLGIPDPQGQIVITVRDFVNNPIFGATVILDFTNCSDSKLSVSQQTGIGLDCANKTLATTTNSFGQAFFIPMGAANVSVPATPPAISPGAGAGCARCYADGVLLGFITVATPDLNGAAVGDGVNAIDYEVLKSEIGSAGLGAPYRGRADLSHDGVINAADLAISLSRYLRLGGSIDLQATPYGRGFCP
jgi:hypothetical protein